MPNKRRPTLRCGPSHTHTQKKQRTRENGALRSSPLPHAPIAGPSGEVLRLSPFFLRLLRLANGAAPPGLNASPVGLGAHAPADPVRSYAVPMPGVASRFCPVLCAPSCSPGLRLCCGCALRGGVCLSLVLRTARVFFFCLSSVLRTTVLFIFLPQLGSACSCSSCSSMICFACTSPDLLVICTNQCLF
jgi:hypothetical protein